MYICTHRSGIIASQTQDEINFHEEPSKMSHLQQADFKNKINLWKLNKRVQLSCSQQVLHIRMSCCVCPATGTGHLGCAREFRTRGFPNKVNIPVRGVCHVQCLVGLMFVPIIREGGEKRRDKWLCLLINNTALLSQTFNLSLTWHESNFLPWILNYFS